MIGSVFQPPSRKEEMMKRLFATTVILMLILMSFGCATVPSGQSTGTQDLGSTVGNRPFVGDSSSEAQKAALGIGRF
jgi:hypothetical protein